MDVYARWLFGAAAVSNFAVGLIMVVLRPLLTPALKLEALSSAGGMFANLTGMMVCLMGVVYALIAFDPQRYRPLIVVGLLGKLGAAGIVAVSRLGAAIPEALPALVVGDVVYALLFAHYLWTTRARP